MAGNNFGIDIGTGYTKIIELDSRKNLINAKSFPTPYTALEGDVKRKIDFDGLLKLIFETFPLRKLQEGKVATSVYSGFTACILVTLPPMPKREMSNAAVMEARRKMIPPPTPDACFESLLLEEKKIEKKSKPELLVVKSEKQGIDERLNIFKNIGIIPGLITTSSFALLSSISREEVQKESIVIIDIGASTLDITIVKNGKQRFFRSIGFGCYNIILDISKELNISESEAEAALITSGVPPISLETNKEASLEDDRLVKLKQVILPHLERMVSEFRRSLIFYKEESGERVERILFSGGGILLKNFLPYLDKNIGGGLQILDPLKTIVIQPHKSKASLDKITPEASLYASACGLAQILCEARRKEETVNFLPLEFKKREQRLIRLVLAVQVGFLFIFALISGWMNAQGKAQRLQASLTGINAEYQALKPFISQQAEVNKKKQKLQSQISLWGELKKINPDVSVILSEISRLIPEEIIITELSLKKTSATQQESAGLGPGESGQGQMQQGTPQQGGGVSGQGQTTPGSGTQGPWTIQLKGETVAFYETFSKLIEELKGRFERSPYFKEVKLNLPKLGKLQPRLIGEEKVELTQAKTLSFSLTANLE